jgi:hypothetical protein
VKKERKERERESERFDNGQVFLPFAYVYAYTYIHVFINYRLSFNRHVHNHESNKRTNKTREKKNTCILTS